MSETQITLDLTGPAMIFATLIGPVLAVWASEWRHSRRIASERREHIFRTLMTTRATRLNLAHVEALNQIDFVFQGDKYNEIREAWKLYRKHLQSTDSNAQEESLVIWRAKASDLLHDLLHELATSLNLPFSKSDIVENSYYPDAHMYNELDGYKMRRLLLEVLEQGRPINIRPIVDTADIPGTTGNGQEHPKGS